MYHSLSIHLLKHNLVAKTCQVLFWNISEEIKGLVTHFTEKENINFLKDVFMDQRPQICCVVGKLGGSRFEWGKPMS